MAERVIEFIRKRDFVVRKTLGQGACGQTVLLYDDVIDEHFVCKKYAPLHESLREQLFGNFIREIKLLHLLHHVNVVRVFNYYLYPEKLAGYILMEYVRGSDIEDHLAKKPEDVNEIFAQVIEGFSHLEANSILHRDIRPQNILVTDGGVVKIIDLGFGKQIFKAADFGKSITLNWWCEPPSEFDSSLYDYRTEVYFVGKLFEKIIVDKGLQQFKHLGLLRRMCAAKPADRVAFFSEVRKELRSDKFLDIGFDEWEVDTYRDFSANLFRTASSIEISAKYYEDILEVQAKLEACYKRVMLEEHVPNSSWVLGCFINGAYYYNTKHRMEVTVLQAFVDLLRASSREKKNIILSNIQAKLDAVARYDTPEPEDDIPF